MKFKFIHSKKGYGKTQYIIEEISKNSEDKIIIFVPSHNTFMIENRLIKFFGESIFSRVEVMDFKKLTSRLVNVYKGFSEGKISDIGKSILINYVFKNNCEQLKYFKSNNKIDFSDEILSVLVDFKNYNFSNEKINEVLGKISEDSELYKKIWDFKILNDAYENELKGKYLDPLDEMVIINSIFQNNHNMFLDYKIYIDGFEIITYYQYEFFKIIFGRAREVIMSLTLEQNNSHSIYKNNYEIKNRILEILFSKNIFDIEEVFINEVNKNKELKYLDENYLKYNVVPYGSEPKNIFINKCMNNFYEVEELCKNIVKEVKNRGFRFREIGILCRDIDSYENFIKVCFDEFNIPYFIDKKNNVNSNVFVLFINSVFEIFKYNFSYGSMFKYIKSGILNLTYDEIFLIENFVIENGIKGNVWFKEFSKSSKIKYSMEHSHGDLEEYLIRINSIRSKIVESIYNFFKDVSDDNFVNYFSKKFYYFLKDNGFINRVKEICEEFNLNGEFAYSDELVQTLNNIFSVFDEINNVFKNEKMSFLDFGEILIHSISKIQVAHVPMRNDEIIIGDISRVLIGNYKALFVIGATSSNFPKIYKKEDILSDNDKNVLKKLGVELSGSNKDKNSSERYLIYSLFNIPSEFLYLSYSISDMEGSSLTPSTIISKIKNIFPLIVENSCNIVNREFGINDISSSRETLNKLMINLREGFYENHIDEFLLSLYYFYKNDENYSELLESSLNNFIFRNSCENLNEKLIRYIYSNYKFSVSSIETYSKCSFKYFLDYIVKVKKRKEYSFDPMDRGTFMHFLMENICRDIKRIYDFKNSSKKDIENFVETYFNEKVFCEENSSYILNTTPRFKSFGNKIKKIVKDSIYFTYNHLSNSEFFHKFYELELGRGNSKIEIEVSPGNVANFILKIDRVDFCENENEILINIIDYKSTNRDIEYGKIYKVLNVQTIAYMKYLIDYYKNIYNKNMVPCGIFYFTLQSPNIKNKFELNLEEEIEKNFKYTGILSSDINKLILIDKDLNEKSSKKIPVNLKKDGIKKSEKLLSDNEFSDLLDFVYCSIKNTLFKIFSGEINISPVLEGVSSKKCTNCNYLGVCKFSRGRNSFDVLVKLKKDEFFNLIKGEE